MPRRHRARFVALTSRLVGHPDVTDPIKDITNGCIQVDGRIITNERAEVRADATIRVVRPRDPRGEHKLRTALDAFGISAAGLVAVDVGAAAGGFTRTLLHRGARRVYAVDVGHGQLLGSLRQDPRVVNLERTNIADLTIDVVPDTADLITMDLSYLPVADAIGQLEGLAIGDRARLLALVKPTFELHQDRLETNPEVVREAIEHATRAIGASRWTPVGATLPSITGAGGAIEAFIHARRQ